MDSVNQAFVLETPKINLAPIEEERYCQVSGIVVFVDKKKNVGGTWINPDFIIETCESHKRFYCPGYSGAGYCNIDAEDVIEAEGLYKPSNKQGVDYELRLAKIPLIEPAVTRSAIIKAIHHCFPRQGRLLLGEAERVFEKLARLSLECPEYKGLETAARVNLYMSKISSEYSKMGGESDAPDKFYPEMEKKDAVKLLKDWYKNRIIRQLRMLGLTQPEIKGSYYEPIVLYEKLKNNPYTVPFISLERAESLSRKFRLGVTNDQFRRGEIVRLLYKNTSESQWCGTPTFLVKKRFDDFDKYRESLTAETDEEGNTKFGWDVRIGDVGGTELICLRICYDAEVTIKTRFVKIIKEYKDHYPGKFDVVYKMPTLTQEQKTAIFGCLNNAISGICGLPGSGKSTLINEIVLNLEMRKINYAIVGFTGACILRCKDILAEANMSETIINKAFTIHRAIFKGLDIPDEDLTHLIIDESSMVYSDLIAQLLQKFPNIRWICNSGDIQQLLPISWGFYFTQLIESERIPIYKLNQIHRTYKVQGETCGIMENVNKIANMPTNGIKFTFETINTNKAIKNFHVIDGGVDYVKDIVRSYKKAGIKDHEFVIITPYNTVREELNRFHQETYYPGQQDFYDSKKVPWRKGNIAVCLENNYDIGVYNSSPCRVLDVNERYMRVSFDKEAVNWDGVSDLNSRRYNKTYNFSLNFALDDGFGGGYKRRQKSTYQNDDDFDLTTKMLARAGSKTVHKCQGGQFNFVVGYFPPDKKANRRFLNRNMLYTLVSRGRRCVFLIGDPDEMEAMVAMKPLKRYDLLNSYLADELEKTEDGFNHASLVIGTFSDEQSREAYNYFAGDDGDEDW